MKRSTFISVSILIILAITLLSISLLSRGKENKPGLLPGTKVKAECNVAFKGDSMIIRNDNHFDWTNLQLTLSHNGVLYHLQPGNIGKGETKGFLLEEFLSSGGAPFNYRQYKPQTVSISCNEAEGFIVVN